MTELTWENARYALGPKLAEWVNAQPGLIDDMVMRFGEQGRRTVHRWAFEQRVVPVEAVDRWLTPVHCLLSELPADVWTDEKPSYAHHSDETKRKAVELRLAGESQSSVARKLGVSPRSVKLWTQRAA